MANLTLQEIFFEYAELLAKLDRGEITEAHAKKLMRVLKRHSNKSGIDTMLKDVNINKFRKIELVEMKRNLSFDFESVTSLYLKYCQKRGIISEEPSDIESYAGNKYFYLRNSKGKIAKFNMLEEKFVYMP